VDSSPEAIKAKEIVDDYVSKIISLLNELGPSIVPAGFDKFTMASNILINCLHAVGMSALEETGNSDEKFVNHIATALRQFLRDAREKEK
jgi:hypothetical protein